MGNRSVDTANQFEPLLVRGQNKGTDGFFNIFTGTKFDQIQLQHARFHLRYEGYTELGLNIKGDRMSAREFKQFLVAAFGSYRTIVKLGASMYVSHSSSWQRKSQDALEFAGFEVRCQLIWGKNTFAWGFGRYKFQHEPIF